MITQNLNSLGEFGLIDWIRQSCACGPNVKKGIGDDTAVLPYNQKQDLLLTTDMFVEDVHFTKRMDPNSVGRKALACNLSDIAAMGGVPTFAVVSIGLPRRTTTAYVQNIYRGINRLAQMWDVYIVGGDTVKSDKIVIDITLLGKVKRGQAILRSGARVGDRLFVTGPLGDSLKSGRHLSFTPRLAESSYLIKSYHPTAMIDISDGLAGDLGHLLKASSVGARIFESKIPLQSGATLTQALFDGEDFELLFTLSAKNAQRLNAVKSRKYPFFEIGEISAKKNTLILEDRDHNKKQLPLKGYSHFT